MHMRTQLVVRLRIWSDCYNWLIIRKAIFS